MKPKRSSSVISSNSDYATPPSSPPPLPAVDMSLNAIFENQNITCNSSIDFEKYQSISMLNESELDRLVEVNDKTLTEELSINGEVHVNNDESLKQKIKTENLDKTFTESPATNGNHNNTDERLEDNKKSPDDRDDYYATYDKNWKGSGYLNETETPLPNSNEKNRKSKESLQEEVPTKESSDFIQSFEMDEPAPDHSLITPSKLRESLRRKRRGRPSCPFPESFKKSELENDKPKPRLLPLTPILGKDREQTPTRARRSYSDVFLQQTKVVCKTAVAPVS